MRGYGEKIRFFRNAQKMSQEDLANKLGVTKSYISKLENEKTPISLDTLGKIADILDVDPKDLIDNTKIEVNGEKWIILGRKMEEQGVTPEQIEEWARIAKYYNDK
ncbi:helix-turn-helix transcriptional regulator [Bacillus sp. FJAT-49736]|uniref:helix-turn-helix domain-containing protein n=1 Tax=Bacillus sp. FJAT-49736 TaxID=2833582 RepID=UPI0032D59DE1